MSFYVVLHTAQNDTYFTIISANGAVKTWKSACALWSQKIDCSFPIGNVDDLHTDRYYYKNKPKSTDALFTKSFSIIKIWIYGENIFKRWQVAIHTWLYHLRTTECHLSRTWFQRSPCVGRNTLFLSSPHLCFTIVFIFDFFVSHDDPLMHADRTTICFEPWQKLRARLGSRKTGLSPLVF